MIYSKTYIRTRSWLKIWSVPFPSIKQKIEIDENLDEWSKKKTVNSRKSIRAQKKVSRVIKIQHTSYQLHVTKQLISMQNSSINHETAEKWGSRRSLWEISTRNNVTMRVIQKAAVYTNGIRDKNDAAQRRRRRWRANKNLTSVILGLSRLGYTMINKPIKQEPLGKGACLFSPFISVAVAPPLSLSSFRAPAPLVYVYTHTAHTYTHVYAGSIFIDIRGGKSRLARRHPIFLISHTLFRGM